MTTRTCRECTTAFAVDLPACPHCKSTDHEETGMAKITVANGATHVPKEQEAAEWPGKPSSASETKPSSTSETSETARPKRVRSTGSRSAKDRAASSSASSATTDGPKTAESSD